MRSALFSELNKPLQTGPVTGVVGDLLQWGPGVPVLLSAGGPGGGLRSSAVQGLRQRWEPMRATN